jgi:hypothetical protein
MWWCEMQRLRTVWQDGLITRLFPLLLIFFTIVVVSIATWVSHNSVPTKAYQPEQFTELYFTQPSDIPSKVKVSVPYTVPFTIANRESSTRVYSYNIIISDGSRVLSVQSGQTQIRSNAAAKQYINFQVPELDKRYRITVQLTNRKQLIQFYTQS